MSYRVSSLYKFVSLEDLSHLRQVLLKPGQIFAVSATILLPPAGIKASVTGACPDLDRFMTVQNAGICPRGHLQGGIRNNFKSVPLTRARASHESNTARQP